MTPKEKLKEIDNYVASVYQNLGDPMVYVLREADYQWLIARVEQLEKLLEGQLNYLHFSADDRRYQVYIDAINDALATGPKSE